MNVDILFNLCYGMHVIGVNDNGRPTGCIVNTVIQVTNVDPIVALSISKDNYTTDIVLQTKQFSVSILSDKTSPSVISALGFSCGKDKNKFDTVKHKFIGDNIPIVDDNCCGYLLCDIISVTDAETHLVILARVSDTLSGTGKCPMTYKYYHEVVKGKAPKNAPTYVDPSEQAASSTEQVDTAKSSDSSVCDICGYTYHGDISAEPDSYTCPLCGVDKSHFK